MIARLLPAESVVRVALQLLNASLHKDVLHALATQLRPQLLTTPAGRPILDRLSTPTPEEKEMSAENSPGAKVSDPLSNWREVRAQVANVSPIEVPVSHRSQYAQLVATAIGEEGTGRVDPERWAPYSLQICQLLQKKASDVSLLYSRQSSDHQRALDSQRAMVNFSHTQAGQDALCATLAHLLTVSDPHLPEGNVRDLPVLRAVASLLASLTQKVDADPKVYRRAGWACFRVLWERQEDHGSKEYGLLLSLLDMNRLLTQPAKALLPTSDVACILEREENGKEKDLASVDPSIVLSSLAEDLTAVPSLVMPMADKLQKLLGFRPRECDSDGLVCLVDALQERSWAHGMFAVRLAHAVGDWLKWPDAWRRTLLTLRTHRLADVRVAARAIEVA